VCPDPLIPAGSTLVQYTCYPLQKSNSTLHKFFKLYRKPTTCKQCPKHDERKRKETVFWVCRMQQAFFQFYLSETLSCSSLCQHCWGVNKVISLFWKS
jgi:hypothetical protein